MARSNLTRTVSTLSASALIALLGAPAFAAEMGDEASGMPTVATAGAEQVDSAASADSATAATERADRRSRSQGGAGATRNAQGRPAIAGGHRPSTSPQQGRPASTRPGSQGSRDGGSEAERPGAHSGNSANPRPGAHEGNSANPRPGAHQGSGSAPRPGAHEGNSANPRPGAHQGSGNVPRPGAHQGNGNAPRPGAHQGNGNAPRPGNTVRPPANPKPGNHNSNHHARPGARPKNGAHKHVVHHSSFRPPRWAPSWHRYHLRGVPHGSPRYWTAGIFVYNAPPRGDKVVIVDDGGHRVKGATKPSRAVNRNSSVAVGLRGGSYVSGYTNGGSYGDLGMGLALRYRPVEAVGLELSWMHHSDTWDEHAERNQDPLSASVQLFAFPWTRVSPYAVVGLTATPRATQDEYFNGLESVKYEGHDALFGPHLGLGAEFAVGKKASLSFDGRYIGYIDREPGDTAAPGAFQGNMGVNFYF